MLGKKLLFGITLVCALGLSAGAHAQAAVIGVWKTANGSEVTIENCSEGYCGRLTKVSLPDKIRRQYAEQIEQVGGEQNVPDFFNEDPDLRMRPLRGVRILTIERQTGEGEYAGKVYNAEEGKTYQGKLSVIDENNVRLSGCILSILCRSEDWKRID